ncbi:Heme exporter protein C [Fundidesulfovibrio magnetotacticus]|uniref:Heme exporter protein C n=1 Tax=Fundidesulfovibrio magnetotacticus TaxID=2730080 RepID=A0A6V8LNV1_9BACT|nr:cytochrome c biogenesis protein CcsA [Fundidesulfovibrio magnetotacticus]GFK94272.1 Heme exporter protein C [Fundidesulfovibrio magnetotacticus]
MTALLAGAAALALAAAQWFIWVYAPVEETMGVVQKIFYIHLPMAWWSMISFLVVFAASVLVLVRKDARWDRLAGAACELGVLFSGLALVTGSLWGKPIWNVWWTWDPRLTTTLVMWFVYCAYLILRQSGAGGERGPVVRAALGIVAFLDVPLVFYSARKWRSIHPTVFGSQGGGLEPEMVAAVVASILAMGILWAAILSLRARQLGQAAAIRQIFLHQTK